MTVIPENLKWTNGFRCDTNACLEVAKGTDGFVYVRGSTNPETVLKLTYEEWEVFLSGALVGCFDLDALP